MPDIETLKKKSRLIRELTIKSIANLGVGHIGGCMSIVDVLTVLYYEEMNIDPVNPTLEGRDRLVISKGHAGPALYSVLADKGYFDISWLDTLNKLGTKLPSHCDMIRTPGVDMTAGSLGQGISCAVGIALGSKINNDGAYIYAIVGDGESQEGQVWEAGMLAAQKKLDNLIVFTDYNGMQIDGTIAEINGLEDIKTKWTSFGFDTQRIDGHDHQAIMDAIKKAKSTKGKPHMIILDTIKGKGIPCAEQAGVSSHNMPINTEQFQQALDALSAE